MSPPTDAPGSHRARRWAVAVLAVVAWMGFGRLAGTGADDYLLPGVPLTAAFMLEES